MPDTKISALPVAGPLTGSELVPLVQGASNAQCDLATLFAAGPAGGPTWTTPAGSTLIWQNIAHTASVSLHDNGQFDVGCQFGGSIGNYNGVTLLCSIDFANNGIMISPNGAGIAGFQTTGGASVVIGNFANSLIESGFTTTSRGFTTTTGGSWGGAGSPPDLETAVDRLAAAVAGLLGGPIP